MAAPLTVLGIEKGLVAAGNDAAIGERRGIERHELRLGFLEGLWPGRWGRRRLPGRLLSLCARGRRHQQSPQQQRPPLHAVAGRFPESGISTEKKAGSAIR